jgi:hypothetical protein
MSRSAGWTVILAFSTLACRGTLPTPNVAAEEPEARIPGIKHAAESRDRSSLPELIESLNDDDPAVRMFAIVALEKFSGDRFGYEYYLDEDRRKPAIARWREWLKQQQEQQKQQSSRP